MMVTVKGELHSFSIYQYVEENDRIVFIQFCRSPQIFIDFEIEAISFVEMLNSTLEFIKGIYFGRDLGENLIGGILLRCNNNRWLANRFRHTPILSFRRWSGAAQVRIPVRSEFIYFQILLRTLLFERLAGRVFVKTLI